MIFVSYWYRDIYGATGMANTSYNFGGENVTDMGRIRCIEEDIMSRDDYAEVVLVSWKVF